jgi:hypothetical protein
MVTSITSAENQVVLDKAGEWFNDVIIKNHILNTKKLKKAASFKLNPLLNPYLSAFLTGSVTPEGIARSLIYARILSTSITTSFGTNIQGFITDVLAHAYGALEAGVDIVFEDKVDGEKKYAQLKLGPNTLNADDVDTIQGHFRTLKNKSVTNHVRLHSDSLIVGIMYGTRRQLSQHYLSLERDHFYPIFVGKDFWRRLTGDELFFEKLIQTISNNLSSVNSVELIENTIQSLAMDQEIIDLANLGIDLK